METNLIPSRLHLCSPAIRAVPDRIDDFSTNDERCTPHLDHNVPHLGRVAATPLPALLPWFCAR